MCAMSHCTELPQEGGVDCSDTPSLVHCDRGDFQAKQLEGRRLAEIQLEQSTRSTCRPASACHPAMPDYVRCRLRAFPAELWSLGCSGRRTPALRRAGQPHSPMARRGDTCCGVHSQRRNPLRFQRCATWDRRRGNEVGSIDRTNARRSA